MIEFFSDKKIYRFFFTCWIIIAIVKIGEEIIHTVRKDLPLVLMTHDQKRQHTLGFFYKYILFCKKNLPKQATIQYKFDVKSEGNISDGPGSFRFIANYYLYPIKEGSKNIILLYNIDSTYEVIKKHLGDNYLILAKQDDKRSILISKEYFHHISKEKKLISVWKSYLPSHTLSPY